jgi:uncharacterized damage-inducible protein DinB
VNLADYRRLFAYDAWANRRLLDAAEALGEDAWTQSIASSFTSLRSTFAHIAGAEFVWLQRWMGEKNAPVPTWYDAPPASHLREIFAAIDAQRRDFLARLSEDDLQQPLEYNDIKGEACRYLLGDALYHVANHSTYHRGQVVTQLRQLGANPPATDFIVFISETET